jgi:hypothetical protein
MEVNMKICLDEKIGAILATDIPINDDRFLRCDGEIIERNEYPNYFDILG